MNKLGINENEHLSYFSCNSIVKTFGYEVVVKHQDEGCEYYLLKRGQDEFATLLMEAGYFSPLDDIFNYTDAEPSTAEKVERLMEIRDNAYKSLMWRSKETILHEVDEWDYQDWGHGDYLAGGWELREFAEGMVVKSLS